jgi:hypothetical protein
VQQYHKIQYFRFVSTKNDPEFFLEIHLGLNALLSTRCSRLRPTIE